MTGWSVVIAAQKPQQRRSLRAWKSDKYEMYFMSRSAAPCDVDWMSRIVGQGGCRAISSRSGGDFSCNADLSQALSGSAGKDAGAWDLGPMPRNVVKVEHWLSKNSTGRG